MARALAGVVPIAHTPFCDDDSIDYASLERQIDWAFECGAQGCATGMVSELLRLTFYERLELTGRLVELVHGRGVLVASVGAESTRQALEYARHAADSGCDAIMAIPPIATRLPPRAVLEYFTQLAAHVDLPLVVQDASAYVGREIGVEVCVALLDQFGAERILFKPEASPIGSHLSALRDASGGRARIFDGSGGIALVDSYHRGIVGTMPGMEFLPAVIALWEALEHGQQDRAYRIHAPLSALVAFQMQAGLDGFLAVEKFVLASRGLFASDRRRAPFAWSLDEESRCELDRLLIRLDDLLR
jgi:2-keto-3-deoxy-L-arabinonate dehydratase